MIKNRSRALDVFRGLSVAFMILINNPGIWSSVYAPFKHSAWHGLTAADVVFPLFLFAVGNALTFTNPDLKKIFKRGVLIFLIGLFLNWSPFLKTWEEVRVMGVLQRIAISYVVAAILIKYFRSHVLKISLGILLLYWVLCLAFGTGDIYSLEGWFGTPVDVMILGQFDPEGIMSSMGSISMVLLGFWAGDHFKHFFRIGFLSVLISFGLKYLQPFNTKIWTSTYTIMCFGLAMILLGVLVIFLDHKKVTGSWAKVFEAFGKNPLFIYVLSTFIPDANVLISSPTPLQWFYTNVCSYFPGPAENGSLFYACILLSLYGLLAMWLDFKKIYIRV